MKIFQPRFIPVAAAFLLLLGAAGDMLRRPRPADAEPFHRRVREAAARIPHVIGNWQAPEQDIEVAQSAVALLKPNVIVQRRYVNQHPGELNQRYFEFLFVQCKDAGDMIGHNPPNCYPRAGWQLQEYRDLDWTVPSSTGGSRVVPGREFEFVRNYKGIRQRQRVVHLIVLPDGKLVRNVEEIDAAEANRTRRFFGAAQIQLLFDDAFGEEARRAVVAEFIGANLELIDTLCSGGTR